jgi:hypothetical protein
MNSSTRETSSVFTHITVPAFGDETLTLSDVVLGTRENASSLPDGAPAIPIVPTTARVFSPSTPAWAFLRVYRAADKGAAVPVSIDTTLFDAGGKRIRHQSVREAAFAGRQADVRLGLPLRDLIPGRYVLRIDAKQGKAEASRATAFAVVARQPTLTEEHSPELDATLAAAARYLDEYEQRVGAISAEEEYAQAVQTVGARIVTGDPLSRASAANRAPATATTATRKTRANIITISLGAHGWVSFRDVFELDGRPVRGREERLARILQNVTPDSLEQARQIAAESGRYNLDPDTARVDRTINVPMTALFYLRAVNQPRSSFRLGKLERVAGVDCVTLQFTEQSRPRLIQTSDDAPAQGTFWIDMAGGGRIVKTELRMQSATRGQIVRVQAAVTYSRVEKLDLWVPTAMDESYDLVSTRQLVTGHARYSDFREFKVNTSEVIK